MLFNKLIRVRSTVDMMVDHTSNFTAEITLIVVQNVVVDQSHVSDGVGGRELGPEFVIKVHIILTDLAILQVSRDLQIAEKVRLIAIDDGHPLLA